MGHNARPATFGLAFLFAMAAGSAPAQAQVQAGVRPDSNPLGTPPVAQPEVRVATRTKPLRPIWPTNAPRALPGAILPGHRIVAFYGNPRSRRMGILGEIPPQQMLAKLDSEVTAWQRADPATPVIPALQLIVSVAQDAPGRDSMYRARMPDSLIDEVAGWARGAGALFFLDVQAGHSTVAEEVERLLPWLARPTVHLALDPEFAMTEGGEPGERIGTLDATDVNRVIGMLDSLVAADSLPPKVLVVHRFTWHMITNAQRIRPTPRVQVVIDMDGWGSPVLKEDSYRAYVYADPVQYTGFKIFYHNDTKAGHPLMTPMQVLRLFPAPLYIQYQ